MLVGAYKMKVFELIEFLSRLPPDKQVHIEYPDEIGYSCWDSIESVKDRVDGVTISVIREVK